MKNDKGDGFSWWDTVPIEAKTQDEFELEDILREFGGEGMADIGSEDDVPESYRLYCDNLTGSLDVIRPFPPMWRWLIARMSTSVMQTAGRPFALRRFHSGSISRISVNQRLT